jgi:hypothetical protein
MSNAEIRKEEVEADRIFRQRLASQTNITPKKYCGKCNEALPIGKQHCPRCNSN